MAIRGLYSVSLFSLLTVANESDDPICKLSEDERFKLCGLVFSSEYFEGRMNYSVHHAVVQKSQCHYPEVSFRGEETRRDAGKSHYREWMIVCNLSVEHYGSHTEYDKVFFLSRAYDPDLIFVYGVEWTNESILQQYLINAFTHIRVPTW